MQGTAIEQLRKGWGMTIAQFAQILGVNPGTVYRWESCGEEHVRIEPMQVQLIALLRRQLEERKTAEEQAELAKAMLAALLVGGGLFALYKLLEATYEPQPRNIQAPRMVRRPGRFRLPQGEGR